MLAPLTALFEGRLRVLQDLSDNQMAQLLPDRIVDYPIDYSLNTDRFSIPCKEIIKMGYEVSPWNEDYAEQTLHFIGTGPDGKDYLYTLANESDMPGHDLSAELRTEKPDVDEDMSEFIGTKAYIYRDGWLFKVGNNDSNAKEKQYYYLTMERAD